MSQNLLLKKKIIQNLLVRLSKLNDSIILDIKEDVLATIATSADSRLMLCVELKGDYGIDCSLNLPSVTKLAKALAMIPTDDITLKLNSNNLEYKGSKVKFKYHLYDEGILTKSKISLERINSFDYDVEFEMSPDIISHILKVSATFKDTNKLYLHTEDGELIWSLQDKTITNSDAFSINGDAVDFEIDQFIFSLDNLRVIDFKDVKTITFKINNEKGFGRLELNFDNFSLNYIILSLVK